MSSSRNFRRSLEGQVGATVLTGFRRYLASLSPERVEDVGAQLGGLLYRVSRRHRERALTNLAMAYPELSSEPREDLARRVFAHYGRMTADFLVSDRRTLADVDVSLTVHGLENIERAREAGKGVLLVTGHYGNWERMSTWFAGHGYPLTVVARDTHNPRINALLQELRTHAGTEVIPRGNAARPIIERLRRNELVGILPDQNSDEVFVPFFGQPAGTVLGPAVIAERTGAAVLLGGCAWVGPLRYEATFSAPLEAVLGHSVKGEGMTIAIHAALEQMIRRHPEQWLWFHDRWKSARQRGLLKEETP